MGILHLLSSQQAGPTQPPRMLMKVWFTSRQSFSQSKAEHPILYLSASKRRDFIFFSLITFILFCICLCYLNFRFLKNSFFWDHFPPPLLPSSPRKSGGLVLTSRARQSTALFCSEPALLPKAEINQSWLRLSRNKSRPVQSWSLPSQNVILWLSPRIN